MFSSAQFVYSPQPFVPICAAYGLDFTPVLWGEDCHRPVSNEFQYVSKFDRRGNKLS